jgi:UDP-glucose:(heptosyl)LPS alpha-1,3-glucosyltransferase
MRLAIVTPSVNRRGGTEKCLSWLIEDLSRHCQLTVFTGEMEHTDASRCRVVRLPMLRHPRLLRYITFLVSNTLALALHRVRRRPAFDLVIATGGDCFFSQVVYAHFCCSAWLKMLNRGSVELPSRTPRQRIAVFHYRAFLWMASLMERLIYRRPGLQAVMAVSGGTRAELIKEYAVDPDKIVVTANPADDVVRLDPRQRSVLRREVRARHGIPESDRVLLFVAAGDWKRKGLLLALRAIALLENPSVHLLVVGRDDIDFYGREAQALGLTSVHFAGFQSKIEGYYAAADVFVYPSSYEAFSLVTLEAAAGGLPLIVTRINGTDELLRDGENGYLVRPEPADIAAKLRRLLADPSRLEWMSAAARASSRRFTRSAVLDQTLDLCARLRPVEVPAA